MGDTALCRVILQRFLADLPMQLGILKQRAVAGDWECVAQQAHRIKGAAATISASALSRAAASVERAVSAAECERLSVLLAELDQEFARVKQVIATSSLVGPAGLA
jgi:HPt (histidine-containing phosphotransfer) domain-containing protein